MKCIKCDRIASHYVDVIYTLDDRWADAGTTNTDDYTCKYHIHTYIQDFDVEGADVIEISVKKLGGI